MNHLDPVLADPIGLQHPGDLPRTDDETIDRPSVLEGGETGETAAMDGKTPSSLDDGFRTGAQPDACQQATRMSMGGVILDDLRIQFTNQMSKFRFPKCLKTARIVSFRLVQHSLGVIWRSALRGAFRLSSRRAMRALRLASSSAWDITIWKRTSRVGASVLGPFSVL